MINLDQKFLVFDIEAVGLHGEGFAVAGGVYDAKGINYSEFAFHCDCELAHGEYEDRQWVAKHVTIHSESIRVSEANDIRDHFWNFWMKSKKEFPEILIAVECGWPVEARFLIDCINDDPDNRSFKGPYPLHEIASFMMMAGLNPMLTYERQARELPAHEPLADSRLSARLLARSIEIININENGH